MHNGLEFTAYNIFVRNILFLEYKLYIWPRCNNDDNDVLLVFTFNFIVANQ